MAYLAPPSACKPPTGASPTQLGPPQCRRRWLHYPALLETQLRGTGESCERRSRGFPVPGRCSLASATQRCSGRVVPSAQSLGAAVGPQAAVVVPSHVHSFQRDGAVCLRGILTANEVECLRQGIDANLANPSPRAKVASTPDDPGLFVEDFCNWREIPEYWEVIQGSALAAAAGALMESRQVRLFHDHMLTKEGGTRQRTPWHQDQPYYNIEGRQNASFWIPVDPVNLESTLQFVAGSHCGPWLMPRTFLSGEAKWFPEGSLREIPDIDGNHENYRIMAWDLQPGDAVAFHMLTLHGSAGVEAGRRRRVFSVRMMGDDVVHAPRPWATSPEFPSLEQALPRGSPMAHPLFPVLWEREG